MWRAFEAMDSRRRRASQRVDDIQTIKGHKMVDRYQFEHSTPRLPLCNQSRASLSFDGQRLILTGSAFRVYPAVSGRPDDLGRFDYSVARQREGSAGPIPPGRYWIQPSQMWTNRWYSLAPQAAWGDHRITIHVFPGTQTYERGGFFIHGGTHAGSAGCINLHAAMESFVRALAEAVASSPDCYIPLTVRY